MNWLRALRGSDGRVRLNQSNRRSLRPVKGTATRRAELALDRPTRRVDDGYEIDGVVWLCLSQGVALNMLMDGARARALTPARDPGSQRSLGDRRQIRKDAHGGRA